MNKTNPQAPRAVLVTQQHDGGMYEGACYMPFQNLPPFFLVCFFCVVAGIVWYLVRCFLPKKLPVSAPASALAGAGKVTLELEPTDTAVSTA